MRPVQILSAWNRILNGYHPVLSVEITRECPLSCAGCYAFQPEHVGGKPLVSLLDFKGDDLVQGVLRLLERHRPLVVYFVGGEPLVRFRELNRLLPIICERNIEVRLVTSAVRPIPQEWASLRQLGIVVSIDGLQPEHDARRKPATYARILQHIRGHHITVHCTLTGQMMKRDGYIEEFVRFWSGRTEVDSIQVSFYTPQLGETSDEILTPSARAKAVSELAHLGRAFPKLRVNREILEAFLEPPSSPEGCVFSRVTKTMAPDLKTVVEPCQIGGNPDCSRCGCLASMGLHAVGRHGLFGRLTVGSFLKASENIGAGVRWMRKRLTPSEVRSPVPEPMLPVGSSSFATRAHPERFTVRDTVSVSTEVGRTVPVVASRGKDELER